MSYGKQINATQLFQLLDHLTGMELKEQYVKPVFLWGKPGIGKTEMIKSYAVEKGLAFAYCAPAQFEEMGDLHGLPEIENNRTIFRKPSWLPDESEGSGILLLDDFNRADHRIIKGLMQLLQFNELMSWKLPAGWMIVCTGNPDDAEYSTNFMDAAVLTRFLHIRLGVDARQWAQWAFDQGLDETGIHFVLAYPELIEKGKLTNARTMTSFLLMISKLKPFEEQVELIQTLGMGLLDPETVAAFIHFNTKTLHELPSVEELLYMDASDESRKKLSSLLIQKGRLRMDYYSTLFQRMLLHFRKEKLEGLKKENLVEWLLMEEVPNDYRTYMMLELNKMKLPALGPVLKDKKLVGALLKGA